MARSMARYNPNAVTFIIEDKPTFEIQCIGKPLNVSFDIKQFILNYKQTHLTCTFEEIKKLVFDEIFRRSGVNNAVLTSGHSAIYTPLLGASNKGLLNNAVMLINNVYSDCDMYLVYVNNDVENIYISKHDIPSPIVKLEEQVATLIDRVNTLECENKKLNNIISIPIQLRDLEAEETTARKNLQITEDHELIDIDNRHIMIHYYVREQQKREEELVNKIRKQILAEMTIPSAPPADTMRI
jgi:hypothetical protein